MIIDVTKQPNAELKIHATIEKEKVGTWLFGLLPVYRYFYSDWKQERHGIK